MNSLYPMSAKLTVKLARQQLSSLSEHLRGGRLLIRLFCRERIFKTIKGSCPSLCSCKMLFWSGRNKTSIPCVCRPWVSQSLTNDKISNRNQFFLRGNNGRNFLLCRPWSWRMLNFLSYRGSHNTARENVRLAIFLRILK